MKHLILLTLILIFINPSAEASRVPEIEQFYSDRVSEILARRFPDKPFTVFVTVDTGKRDLERKAVAERTKNIGYKLPYTEWEAEELDIWERVDVPLGTLISQLQGVKIEIKVDSSLADAEVEDLKLSIAKQLRLDDRADSVAIARMDWTEGERKRELYYQAAQWGAGVVILFGVLFLLARLSIRHLVKGLSKPIQEIGLNTKRFADEALNIASDLTLGSQHQSMRDVTSGLDDQDGLLGSSLLEVRKNALELLERNRDLFQFPDAHLLEFLERKGNEDPKTLGSVLAELKESELLEIFRYGKGDWWFVALSNPGVMNSKSLKILSEVDRLRMRRHFAQSTEEHNETDAEVKALLVLSRLSEDKLVEICSEKSPQEVFPVLAHLPRHQALATAKAAFPGHWAQFLEHKETTSKFDPNTLKFLAQKAVDICPLREKDEIRDFFSQLDTATYLDSASPSDEKDFYKVLPASSQIKKFRFPFFQLLDGDKDILKTLGPVLNVNEWAQVLFDCDEKDREKILSHLPERLTYQVKQSFQGLRRDTIDHLLVARGRKSLTRFYLEQQQHSQAVISASPKEALDSNAHTG